MIIKELSVLRPANMSALVTLHVRLWLTRKKILIGKEIYVIHQPGGPYWEKLCPRSWIPPEAAGRGRYSRQRAQFFPIRTDLGS